MRVVEREPIIEVHQYIYPSSALRLAGALGGMVDSEGNLWLDLAPNGVQLVPCDRWIICRSGRPTQVMTRADVQETFVPLDWQEGQRALGGTVWAGDPDPMRHQGAYLPSYA